MVMVQQLRNDGSLMKCSGILFGCNNERERERES